MDTNSQANIEFFASIRRLLKVANTPTGQGRKVADFLLSWWNAETCGKFDPTDLWAVDAAIQLDMLRVLMGIARCSLYPDSLGFKAEFDELVAYRRPDLIESED
jgi:hypothetical protein